MNNYSMWYYYGRIKIQWDDIDTDTEDDDNVYSQRHGIDIEIRSLSGWNICVEL